VLFNRGRTAVNSSQKVRVILGDRSESGGLAAAVGKETFDAVIDMICFNAADAAETLRVFLGRVSQIVITSSIAAYKRPYNSLPTRESAETLTLDPVFPYAFNKAELERYIWNRTAEENLPVTVIRPSLTYGIGSTNIGVLRQNFGIIDRIRKGKPLVMFGDGSTPWQFTFARDLAKAYTGVLGNPKAYGQVYHATSDEIHRWEDLYLEFGKIVGVEPRIVHLPSELLMKASPGLFTHLYLEKTFPGVFDNSGIRSAVPSYKAEVSLSEGLREIADCVEEHANSVDREKDSLEDALVALHSDFAAKMANLGK
jgi:nucleoside-diphosphate-sugar epimerase